MKKNYLKKQYINYRYFIIFVIFICLFKPFITMAAEKSIKEYYDINLKYSSIPKELEKSLKEWKRKANIKKIPPDASESYLNYLLEQDKIALKLLLESGGYYSSEIDVNVNLEKHQANFVINLREVYEFTDPIIIVNSVFYNKEKDLGINLPPLKQLKVQKDKEAKVSSVIEDEKMIYNWIEKNNCFFHYAVAHKAIVDHLNHTVTVSYEITHDKNAVFGDIRFSNLSNIDEIYLKNLLTIKKGECFKRSSINNTRLSFRKSNILDKIKVVLPESPEKNGSIPVFFILSEKDFRTVKTGANYSTDTGFGYNVGWEHRNIFSQGERLTSNLYIAEIEKELSVILQKPFFLRKDQTLKISGSIKEENNDAYDSKGIILSESVERKLKDNWVAGIGSKYDYESVTEDDVEDNYFLVSIPLYAKQNKKDNALNPQKGWTVDFNVTPTVDTLDTNILFMKNYISGTYYIPVVDNKLTLAFKAGVGSVIGSPAEDMPATERFYAGGATSVRGYGYQLVGPLDSDNDPIGGSSILELSTELRLRISEDYGLVPFMDCGSTYTSKYFDSGEQLLCGAGIGLRYYTSFGPLRVDVAVPLDKRSGVDDSFQLYFSIGQSF